MIQPNFFLGIDPGPVNTGIALSTSSDGELLLLETQCVNFSGLTPFEISQSLSLVLKEHSLSPLEARLTIERFVSYAGVASSSFERTCVIVGALASLFENACLIKAIDWKTSVAQNLYRDGFRNPSEKKDKKFSMAAAQFVFSRKFKTDHEADAALLSYYGFSTKE